MKNVVKAIVAGLALVALSGAALAEGDAVKGEKVFKKCKACHAVGEGAKNKIGPMLNDLIGRKAGAVEGFKYSSAMKEAGEKGLMWTDENLAKYLKKPRKFIKKGKMAFAGLRKEKDQMNIIAYLKKFSKEKK